MAEHSKSFVWQYYDKNTQEESAKCKRCKAIIMCRGWSTSGLLRHLKNKHAIEKPPNTSAKRTTDNISDTGDSSGVKRKPSQQKITDFMRRDSREVIVSKLVAVDGFSVNAITKSDFIREALSDRGYSLPRNPTHVMELIHKQYDVTKAKVKEEMHDALKMGSRFSLSLDEYSSLRNKRYLNINVHSHEGKFWNLGMVNISGQMPAEKAVETVENKLVDFDLSLEKHIVACVTDGASVMVKFGKQLKCEHHLCYAHVIHLAVCDVLYKKKKIELNVEDSDFESDNDFDTVVEIVEARSLLGTIEINERICDESEDNITCVNISETIQKVRKIVKLFRKSPLKNETLQNYVKTEHDHEKMLILDSKTRWNSMLAMLERFLEIKSAVIKALVDYNICHDISEKEYSALKDIVLALQPVKLGAEKLCSRNATLLSAEGVFKFIITELRGQNSVFARKITNPLIKRINERRNAVLVGLIQYLNSGKNYSNCGSGLGLQSLPSKSSLLAPAKNMLMRLFDVSEDSDCSSSEGEEETQSRVHHPMTLAEKLEAAIQTQSTSAAASANISKHLEKELRVFEATGERTTNITNLLNSLKSIPPTSVESERAFSAAGLFITKLRTRLSDKSVDCLCFLRSFFKNS